MEQTIPVDVTGLTPAQRDAVGATAQHFFMQPNGVATIQPAPRRSSAPAPSSRQVGVSKQQYNLQLKYGKSILKTVHGQTVVRPSKYPVSRNVNSLRRGDDNARKDLLERLEADCPGYCQKTLLPGITLSNMQYPTKLALKKVVCKHIGITLKGVNKKGSRGAGKKSKRSKSKQDKKGVEKEVEMVDKEVK